MGEEGGKLLSYTNSNVLDPDTALGKSDNRACLSR